MYNLFRFLLRYHLLLLFLALEGFCFFLIYRNSRYHEVMFVSAANDVNGKVFTVYSEAAGYLHLRSVNDSLAAENASLRARLLESKYDNKVDSGRVYDTIGRFVQTYAYIPAHVIRNSVSQSTNYIFLDRGSKQGIKKQMGVICPNGIVGQVVGVTENYASVMSVLSDEFKVSAKFKNSEYFGNLHWTGGNVTSALLENIPKHATVKPGDTVVTSGYSLLFPKNVMVGVVEKVTTIPERNFLDVSVKLSTDFGNLNYVYIVNNMKRAEMQQFDTLVIKEK